jgi:20S proteasome alpha/beta subunit
MTICVAALFRWDYGLNDVGFGIVTASDRMFTAGDVEFEPNQAKICHLTPRILILVAGELPVHSEAIRKLQQTLAGQPNLKVDEVAEIYGSFIRGYRQRQTEQFYLAPHGLTHETFRQHQSEMAPSLVADLVYKIEHHIVDAEAIVAGSDVTGTHLYHVDCDGFVSYHNDAGFLTIGIGQPHAKSFLMTRGYAKEWAYSSALVAVYSAKKHAEVAPGVGKMTDMRLISRDGWQVLPEEIFKATDAAYTECEKKITLALHKASLRVAGAHARQLKQLEAANKPKAIADNAK